MMPTPNLAATGARRPAPATILRPVDDAASLPLDRARVGSAGGLSVAVHGVLLVLFALFAPTGQADGPIEVRDTSLIEVDSQDEINSATFSSTDVNETSRETHQNISYNLARQAEVSIPGQVDPAANLGLRHGAADVPPVSMPPLHGVGGIGAGGSQFEGVNDAPGLPRGLGDPFQGNSLQKGLLGRSGGTQQQLLIEGGGGPATEAAVAKGLRWLARHQSNDGRWKLDGNFPDKGNANDVAGTALGLLPFLGAGKTHKAGKDNLYDKPIDRALRYLMSIQDKRTGAFSRDLYAHGLAAIAMSEALGLSQDYGLKKSAQLAINFIVKAQHDGGGWRYSPGQAGDTSVSGWQIMALKSGLMAGLEVPPITLRKAQIYLDGVVDAGSEGYGYTGPQATPTMTAVALLARQYLQNWGRQNIRLIKGVDNHIKPNSPRLEKSDAYYLYYATQVMHNLGGQDWKDWNNQMRTALLKPQADDRANPATYGSWSPGNDPWGRTGGRLMMTSLNILTLEVYYRYLPLYYREKGS